MKYVIIIFFALPLFYSCSKNKSSAPTYSLYGRWYFAAESLKYYTNGILDSAMLNNQIKYNHTDYLQLNNNRTCSTSLSGVVTNFTYYLDNQDSLTFAYSGTVDVFYEEKIDILTATELKIFSSTPYGVDGASTVTDYFTKQQNLIRD